MVWKSKNSFSLMNKLWRVIKKLNLLCCCSPFCIMNGKDISGQLPTLACHLPKISREKGHLIHFLKTIPSLSAVVLAKKWSCYLFKVKDWTAMVNIYKKDLERKNPLKFQICFVFRCHVMELINNNNKKSWNHRMRVFHLIELIELPKFLF